VGVKIEILHSMLPVRYRHLPLIPSSDGMTSTLYLLGDKYALKIFDDDTTNETIDNEINLLDSISELLVPRVVEHITVNHHQAIIYSQISGKSPQNPTQKQISQIAIFLKELHAKTDKIKKDTFSILDNDKLLGLIKRTGDNFLLSHFENTEINLENDTIIHSDLFRDNAKFIDDRLTGVYDFSDACLGDFRFDLAVVAIDWCFRDGRLDYANLDILLDSYGSGLHIDDFLPYMRFAILYHGANRVLCGRNHHQLMQKLIVI